VRGWSDYFSFLFVGMPLDDAMSEAGRELTEQVAKEHDPVKFCQLVWAINIVLDLTEDDCIKLNHDDH
jgi:hypothetical protein